MLRCSAGGKGGDFAVLSGKPIGVHYVERVLEKLRGVRAAITQTFVDVAGPTQRGLARVAQQNVVYGRTPRQNAGDNGEQTKNHQTGHDKPIPRADFLHLTTPITAPKNAKGAYKRRCVKAGPTFPVNATLTLHAQAKATLRKESSPKLSLPSATGLPPSLR
jgi:hypothetical protein